MYFVGEVREIGQVTGFAWGATPDSKTVTIVKPDGVKAEFTGTAVTVDDQATGTYHIHTVAGTLNQAVEYLMQAKVVLQGAAATLYGPTKSFHVSSPITGT